MKTKLKGKFVVLEGGDGAGKGTQTELLINALSRSVVVQKFDFPQYEGSIFGKLCGEALKGLHGDFRHLSPHLASLPYTLDRVTAQDRLKVALKKGLAISNRYTPSNTAYQAAKLTGKEKTAFVSFLETAEYSALGIVKPDLVIYLHVPVDVAHALVAQKDTRSYMGKKGARDQHESDIQYQRDVVKTYLWLARTRPDWKVIDCTRKGKLLSREEIHEMVLDTVNGSLG
jgi:dTMP kinase